MQPKINFRIHLCINAPLFYGALFFLIGVSIYLSGNFYLLLLCLPFKTIPKILILSGYFYLALFYPMPRNLKPTPGQVYFSITSIRSINSFKKGMVYTGKINHRIKANIYLSNDHNRPPANKDYLITGVLHFKNNYFAVFKPDNNPWQKINRSFSLAEMRYAIKTRLRRHLKKTIKHTHARRFLTALATNDFKNPYLSFVFNKTGLQHVLAISGFHFSLLIIICSLFLNNFRCRPYLLMILSLLYLLFIGSTPSMQRAYFMITITLLGQILERKHSSINALGGALFIQILFQPIEILNAGCQLSFLASGSILLIYPCIEKLIRKVLKKRSPSEIRQLSLLAQHGYIISVFLRKALSLTLAVNIATVPLILYHFQTFPLISFFYNLFFPPLVGISLFLLVIGLICTYLCPPLSMLFHYINSYFTQGILNIVITSPSSWQVRLHHHPFSVVFLIIYIFILFYLTIKLKDYLKVKTPVIFNYF